MKTFLLMVTIMLGGYVAILVADSRAAAYDRVEIDDASDTALGADTDGRDWQPVILEERP